MERSARHRLGSAKSGMVGDDTRLVNAVVSKKLECEPTLVCSFSTSWHEGCGDKPVNVQFVHSQRV